MAPIDPDHRSVALPRLSEPPAGLAGAVLAALPAAVLVFDSAERLVYANPVACGLFSPVFDRMAFGGDAVGVLDVVGHWFRRPDGPDLSPVLLAALKQAPRQVSIAGRDGRAFLVRTAIGKGHRVMTWLETTGVGAGGAVGGGAGVGSAAHQVAALLNGGVGTGPQLQVLVALLQGALDAVPEAIAAVDRDANLIACNRHYIALLGIDRTRMVVGQGLDFALDQARERFADFRQFTALGAAIAREPQRIVQGRIDWRDGRIFSVVVAPLWVDAAILGRVWSWLDVTERERSAAAAAAALKVAEQNSAAKTAFLGTISHELRTPMNGILGSLELLRESPLDAAQSGYVHAARSSAESLLRMFNQILDLIQLEDGRLVLERVDFSPAAEVEAVAAAARTEAGAKGLTLELSGTDGKGRVCCGDPGRFRQIVASLVDNAIKFTERGTVRISLQITGSDGGNCNLRVDVADTGIGIPDQQRQNLFESFSQGDGSRTRRHGGVGVGLAVAARLVKAMGGTIGLDSEPDGGSRFWFTLRLPIARAPLAAVGQSSRTLPRSLRILVAEDNEVNRMVLNAMLVKAGYRADLVDDGRKAVTAAAGAEPCYDLILMDIHMPEMDGIAATQAIRRLPGTAAGAYIAAVTADPHIGERAQYTAIGLDDYIGKPVRVPALLAVIERAATKIADRAGAGA